MKESFFFYYGMRYYRMPREKGERKRWILSKAKELKRLGKKILVSFIS